MEILILIVQGFNQIQRSGTAPNKPQKIKKIKNGVPYMYKNPIQAKLQVKGAGYKDSTPKESQNSNKQVRQISIPMKINVAGSRQNCMNDSFEGQDSQNQEKKSKDQSLWGALQDLLEETDLNERPPCRQTDKAFNLENEYVAMQDAWTKEKPKPAKFIDNRIFQRPPSRHKTPPKALGLDLPPSPCTPPDNDIICDNFDENQNQIKNIANFEKKKYTE